MLDARAVQENESLWPTATTPVLVSRPLNPNHHAKRLSLYGDDYWDFTPAMFEAHQTATGYDFAGMPVSFKHVAKRYVWLQLNHPDPPRLRTTTPARLAVHTIREGTGNIKPFFAFLERQGVRQLSEVTPHHLDTFLAAIKDDSISTQKRQKEAYEVRRLWVYRHLLPVEDRLPDAPPWEGERTRDLVGQRDYNEENATPRIPDEIMTPLLCWAIRFVEDFAEDIVAARKEYIELCNGTADGRRAARSQRTQLSNRGPIREEGGRIRRDLIALLESYRQRAKPLPGRRNEAGDLVVDYEYLARLVFSNGFRVKRYGDLLSAHIRDIGIADGAFVHDRVVGLLDGSPWRDRPLTFVEVPELSRLLITACFIIINYLSGMRPGETLNLVRGAGAHDPVTGLDYVHGKKFKNAVDSAGEKKPEGEGREIPWTVIPIVVRAIHVVESLHNHPLLFPNTLGLGKTGHLGARQGKARSTEHMIQDIASFITWINTYCSLHHRPDVVPPDPDGRRITPSRFRRTLAWYIWRKPRGPVAAALQYGHVHVRITQGCAGTYASGFPDDYAMEEFLERLDRVAEDERRLRDGEHVSGPAAKVFRDRTGAAAVRFAGRIIRTNRQAHAALNSPELQVFHGRAMVCVFHAAKALCQLSRLTEDDRRTPDLTDCRPECQNIARTDHDIEILREGNVILAAEVEDPLAPEPRRMRAQIVMEGKESIIAAHEATRVISKGLTNEP